MEEDFDAASFLVDVDSSYECMVGQYFEKDYCPTVAQIENMYKMTDLSSIEVPLSVKDMFSIGE